MPCILFLFILISSLLFPDFTRSLCLFCIFFSWKKHKHSYAMEYHELFDMRSHVSATTTPTFVVKFMFSMQSRSFMMRLCVVVAFSLVFLFFSPSLCISFLLVVLLFFSHLTSRLFYCSLFQCIVAFYCNTCIWIFSVFYPFLPLILLEMLSILKRKRIEFVQKHCWAARSVECARVAKWCIGYESTDQKRKYEQKFTIHTNRISFGAWVFLLMLLQFHSRCILCFSTLHNVCTKIATVFRF